MSTFRLPVLLLLAASSAGCGKPEPKAVPREDARAGAARAPFTLVDHVTQRATVVQGRDAMNKVRDINAKRIADMDQFNEKTSAGE